MVQVKLTHKIKRWIPTVLSQKDLPEDVRKQLNSYYTGSNNVDDPKYRQIPFSLVKTLHECLKKEQGLCFSYCHKAITSLGRIISFAIHARLNELSVSAISFSLFKACTFRLQLARPGNRTFYYWWLVRVTLVVD